MRKYAFLAAALGPVAVSAASSSVSSTPLASSVASQASSVASGAAPASSAPAAGSGSSAAVSAVDTGVPGTASSVSWSLAATNPTAVPLSDIVPGTITTQATVPLTATFGTGGAVPTYLSNAPPLPDIVNINPANYPALDKLPPTDSPEVQQWIAEVNASGITIPDIPVTQPGGCPANPDAVADASRCWWTCGGCTRDTDIVSCPDKLTWGLTYDDGPAPYTPNLLQYLDQHNLTTTFFVVGSRAISYPALLQQEYMSGHQLAVHTWSHPSMTTVSTEGLIAELGWTKKVIKDITGVTPLYFRPPYGDIDDRVRAIIKAMGLIPVIWTRISPTATFDTGDFNVPGGTTSVSQVLQNWEFISGNISTIDTGFIVLEHDLFAQTVDLATGYILPAALANNPPLNIKPVISCLNKPFGDAYLETNDNATDPLPTASNAAPVTFSSGAPGSAQATNGANSSTNSTTSGSASTGGAAGLEVRSSLLLAAGTAALGLLSCAFTLL